MPAPLTATTSTEIHKASARDAPRDDRDRSSRHQRQRPGEAVLAGITDLFDLPWHHHHEDVFVQPLIEAHAPDAMIVTAQHIDVDEESITSAGSAEPRAGCPARLIPGRTSPVPRLPQFTSALAHQLVERSK
jgi:hypothetical protein